jgi:hypothetical protein
MRSTILLFGTFALLGGALACGSSTEDGLQSTQDASGDEAGAAGSEDAALHSAEDAGAGVVVTVDGGSADATLGPSVDAGLPMDSSMADAGQPIDTGAPSDGRAAEDAEASPPFDASAIDSTAPVDAALGDAGSTDGAAGEDAAVAADAGVPRLDAASPVDAMPEDAANPDAAPSCVIPPGAWTATITAPAPPPETAPGVDSVISVALPANDILYDPYTRLLYASVPSSFGTNGNSIARIDPTTGDVLATVYVGSEPGTLAESADGQFLYVALNGANAIRRYTLATQTPDLQFSISDSPYGAAVVSIGALPNSPHSVLVSLGGNGTASSVVVFDDGVQRGVALSTYANDVVTTGSDALAFAPYIDNPTGVLCIDSGGVHLSSSISAPISPLNDGTVRFGFSSAILYSPSGAALNTVTGALAGTYASQGALAVEPGLDRVYFLEGAWPIGGGTEIAEIDAYDLGHFTPVGNARFANAELQLSPVGGRLVRWGRYGFAFAQASPVAISIVRTSLVPASP